MFKFIFLGMSNDDVKKQLYLHLHEQYATNNNANLTTVMTLVVALVAVIGYYGYIFIHTSTDNINKDKTELAYNVINKTHFQDGDIYVTNKTYLNQAKKSQGSFYDAKTETYSLEALSLIYCGSIFILGILFCVCTYQGISQRKEQFIIYAIRDEYFKDKTEQNKEEQNKEEQNKEEHKKILPDGYQPFNKKGLEVIQGLYGELVKIFFWVAGILTLLTYCRMLPICDITMCRDFVITFVAVTLFLLFIPFLYQICSCKNKSNARTNEQCNKICCIIRIYWLFVLILTFIVILIFLVCKTSPCTMIYMTIVFPLIVFICCFKYFIKQDASYIDRQLEYPREKYNINKITDCEMKCIKRENCNLCKVLLYHNCI